MLVKFGEKGPWWATHGDCTRSPRKCWGACSSTEGAGSMLESVAGVLLFYTIPNVISQVSSPCLRTFSR